MVKFFVKGLSLEDNTYTTPKGTEYKFLKRSYNIPTVVNDKDDIDYFRNGRSKNRFEEVKLTDEIKNKGQEIIDKATGKEKVNVYTAKQLKKFVRTQQDEIIREELKYEGEIPRLEDDVIQLILKLQKERDTKK